MNGNLCSGFRSSLSFRADHLSELPCCTVKLQPSLTYVLSAVYETVLEKLHKPDAPMTLHLKPHICFLECSLFKQRSKATADKWGMTWVCGRWSLQWSRDHLVTSKVNLNSRTSLTLQKHHIHHRDTHSSPHERQYEPFYRFINKKSSFDETTECLLHWERAKRNQRGHMVTVVGKIHVPSGLESKVCAKQTCICAQKSGATGSNFYWLQVQWIRLI